MSIRRLYETTYILNAALEDNEIEEAITRINEYIVQHGGILREVNRWGRRRLAYPIKKRHNGYYVHCIYEAPASSMPLLERYFVLDDSVLRHLTVQLSERLLEYRRQRAAAQGVEASAQSSAPSSAAATPEKAAPSTTVDSEGQ